MTILGEAALTEIDLKYAEFADAFEKEYVSQGYTNDRSIEETLAIKNIYPRINPHICFCTDVHGLLFAIVHI